MDIALDTFPCAGGTTTFDALWMGVPVVSLAGDRPFSRGGASILGNLGLTQWLVETREDYIERAVELGAIAVPLAAIRRGLRARLEASALMDAPLFARSMEEAIETMCVARGLGAEPGMKAT